MDNSNGPYLQQWLTTSQPMPNPHSLDDNFAPSLPLNWPGDSLNHPWFDTQFIPPNDTVYPNLDFSLQNPPLGIDNSTNSSDGQGSMPWFDFEPSPPSLPSPVTTTNTNTNTNTNAAATAATHVEAGKRRARSSMLLVTPDDVAVKAKRKYRRRQSAPETCQHVGGSSGGGSGGDADNDDDDNDNDDDNDDYDYDTNNGKGNDRLHQANSSGHHLTGRAHPTRHNERPVASPSRLRVREKNRIAAGKCRSRQRKAVSQLTVQHEGLEGTNRKLCATLNDLEAESYVLKNMLMEHGNCGCELIQRYFMDVAAKVVQDMKKPNSGQEGG